MVDATERFRPNTPPVLQETLDDETIVVDLDSGSYYSLRGSGSYVWRLLESGVTVSEAADHVAQFYGEDRDAVASDVTKLVEQLVADGLVVAVEGDVPAKSGVMKPNSATYDAPALAKYTDMQELLLLDPVHDVDETGWPAAR